MNDEFLSMKKIPFLRQRSARIRNLTILVMSMILTVLVVVALVLSQEITAVELLIYGVFYVLVCVPIMVMPFGNMLEWRDDGNLMTYFQVGPFQFDIATHENPLPARIEKGEKNRYWIAIDYARGKKILIEHFPTTQQAEQRINEINSP